MGSIALECPWLYLWSRLCHGREWGERGRLFKQRDPMEVRDWVGLGGPGQPWDEEVCKRVLAYVGDYFGVDYRRLRPEDRLNKEIRIPGEKLHHLLLCDCFDAIDDVLEEHVDIDIYPTPEWDMLSCTLAQLLSHAHRILREFPKRQDSAMIRRAEDNREQGTDGPVTGGEENV